jgi:hypothetical protein
VRFLGAGHVLGSCLVLAIDTPHRSEGSLLSDRDLPQDRDSPSAIPMVALTIEATRSDEFQKGEVVKIGFLAMPFTGHLTPMIGLGRRLKSHGHEIIFVGMLDSKHAAMKHYRVRALSIGAILMLYRLLPVRSC